MHDDVVLQRRFVSTSDYAASSGEIWIEAFSAHPVRPDRAISYGRTPDFLSKLDPVVPPVGVIESTSLFVAGPSGTICSSDGTILPDHSWFREHHDQMPVKDTRHKVLALGGRALSLASDWAGDNYGHFIQDVLPRIEILRQVGIELSRFDHVICGVPTAFCMSLLELAGVEPSKVVRPRAAVALKADVLVAPTFPGSRRGMESWAIEFFRRLTPKVTRHDRRLYIPRQSRKPVNESALLAILKPLGFELFAPEIDQKNQAKKFAEAAFVIGSAGSALANLVFCRPGTFVLELLPSDHIFPYYFCISMAAGLRYHCMVGDSVINRADSSIGPSKHNFNLDEILFAQALRDILHDQSNFPHSSLDDVAG